LLKLDDTVDILHTEEISEDENVLPSPEDLSGYILVKVVLLCVVIMIYSL